MASAQNPVRRIQCSVPTVGHASLSAHRRALPRHLPLAPHQAKRHGKTKEYLLAMAERGLQLDLKASATAMRAFIESKKYDDVLWVFESLPSWGAARDEGHAALLIQVRFHT